MIEQLITKFKHVHSSTVKGMGDDAAILRYGNETLAVTTAMMVGGSNFDLCFMPMQHLGYKAAVSAFSNLYAMNAMPRQLLTSVVATSDITPSSLDMFYDGVKIACNRNGADLVFSDLMPSEGEVSITMTAIGQVDHDRVTYRNTAKIGDLICVSGDLGGAYLGLKVLARETEFINEDTDLKPTLKKYLYALERLLKPESRRDIVEFLAAENILPTAMTNIIYGLSPELLRLCNESHVGCEIYVQKLPTCDEIEEIAEEFHLEPSATAMYGGGDYELLFTVPLADASKIAKNEYISILGRITEPEKGCYLVFDSELKHPLRSE